MAPVIGLIYDKDENWIAGSYYIENLISALCRVNGEKPTLKIYTRLEENFIQLREKTQYPNMQWVELADKNNLFDRIINKFSYSLFGTHWATRGIDRRVDILFPASDSFYFDGISSRLYWIPDFQEKHYPEFFQKEEIARRKQFQQQLVQRKHPIIFSSEHARLDFEELYPNAQNKRFVMPFAVTLPNAERINFEEVKRKFKIPDSYFICSNQFWAHKNHKLILEALKKRKADGQEETVVFTGKPFDSRNPEYYQSLLNFVEREGLEKNVLFLGFIEREEQLVLIKHSKAVIQPSLFEGWSTIIEDAKSLGAPILASDLPVHREQLPGFTMFFGTGDAVQLASRMSEVDKERGTFKITYDREIENFGNRFLRIMKESTT